MGENSDPYMTGERIATITTDTLEHMAYAVKLLAAQLMAEPSGVYLNMSTKYASSGGIVAGGGGSALGIGSFALPSQQQPYGMPPQQQSYGMPSLGTAPGLHGFPGQQQQLQVSANLGPKVHLTFGVPDVMMGQVLGKAGSGIKTIAAYTATAIKVHLL